MDEDQRDVRDDKPGAEAGLQKPGQRCTFILASSEMGAAAKFAAGANLALREWAKLPSDGEFRAYRLVDGAAELTAIAPLRSWEVREGDGPQKAVR
jgi:hypothetical protein